MAAPLADDVLGALGLGCTGTHGRVAPLARLHFLIQAPRAEGNLQQARADLCRPSQIRRGPGEGYRPSKISASWIQEQVC
jgi:hypothetical protein